MPRNGLPDATHLANGADQVAALELGDGVAEGAHAGQHDFVGSGEFRRVASDGCRVPDFLKAFLHAAQVAHLVVDDGDHEAGFFGEKRRARLDSTKCSTSCGEEDSPILLPDHLAMVPDRKIGTVPGCWTCAPAAGSLRRGNYTRELCRAAVTRRAKRYGPAPTFSG